MSIQIITADITELNVDAVVNAANTTLLGGGGVDGAIHRAAGPELLQACRALPQVKPGVRCPTGEARITPGFRLPARYVIHTVGPVWHGGAHDEPSLLASCYEQSMALALDHDVDSIAFPAISCGIYGYPPERAAPVALRSLRASIPADTSIQVLICCFGDTMASIWRAALNDAG
ncbi:O-acetyl-ADP-ribose deacetylase [Dyella jiangningensis]|uniref:O-acetyl-ADP-ribose deacetylase n=1 Tax=Dyella jiangningensis TaxID=1379159 RepID=A0A328P9B6_9GAMM|nr:O-acetyl-ADP-ribose deacetylase [Dyella jiangningensis]RAO76864.1 O-acetyl-ADP-ribose deacetylase [Dyella jiangningensis]